MADLIVHNCGTEAPYPMTLIVFDHTSGAGKRYLSLSQQWNSSVGGVAALVRNSGPRMGSQSSINNMYMNGRCPWHSKQDDDRRLHRIDRRKPYVQLDMKARRSVLAAELCELCSIIAQVGGGSYWKGRELLTSWRGFQWSCQNLHFNLLALHHHQSSSFITLAFSRMYLPSLYFWASSYAFSYFQPRTSWHWKHCISATVCNPVISCLSSLGPTEMLTTLWNR